MVDIGLNIVSSNSINLSIFLDIKIIKLLIMIFAFDF